MTITTEEAEWLAKQHDLVRFTLGMKAPEHDLTAATIRSLAAERDELQARVAELEGALRPFAELGKFVVEHHPDPETDLNHEMSALVRHFRNAYAALEGKRE